MILNNYVYEVQYKLGNFHSDEKLEEVNNFIKDIVLSNKDVPLINFYQEDSLSYWDELVKVVGVLGDGYNYKIVSSVIPNEEQKAFLEEHCFEVLLNIQDSDINEDVLYQILPIDDLSIKLILNEKSNLKDDFSNINKFMVNYLSLHEGKICYLKLDFKPKTKRYKAGLNRVSKDMAELCNEYCNVYGERGFAFISYIEMLIKDFYWFYDEKFMYLNEKNWFTALGVNNVRVCSDANLYSFTEDKVMGKVSDEFFEYFSNLMEQDFSLNVVHQCENCPVLGFCRNNCISNRIGPVEDCDLLLKLYMPVLKMLSKAYKVLKKNETEIEDMEGEMCENEGEESIKS